MRLVLFLNGLGTLFGGDVRLFLDVARAAEDAGIDDLMVVDRLVVGPRWDSYSFGPLPPESEWFPEPLTLLTAVATATSTIRISTGTVIGVVRPAVVLAKIAATLDRISRGRLDLGVGSGWQAEELEACGVPMRRRTERLEHTIRACRALWTGENVSYESPVVTFHNVVARPTPEQPRLPVWFGGPPTISVMDRIAELGDGWIAIAWVTPEGLAEGTRLLRAAYVARGRDPLTAQVRGPGRIVRSANGSVDVRQTVNQTIALLRESGATQAYLGLAG